MDHLVSEKWGIFSMAEEGNFSVLALNYAVI
jgi:hypothetical protein